MGVEPEESLPYSLLAEPAYYKGGSFSLTFLQFFQQIDFILVYLPDVNRGLRITLIIHLLIHARTKRQNKAPVGFFGL
jgi:hypothetical protein